MRTVFLLAFVFVVAVVALWRSGFEAKFQPLRRDQADAPVRLRLHPTLRPKGKWGHAEVAAAGARATATGHVMDRTGRPVGGARVTWGLTRGGEKTTVRTAPSGTFRIEKTAGSIDLQVVAEDGRRASIWCVSGQGREPFWIRVHDVARLRGTVRSETDGVAVAGATVTAWGFGFGATETETLADGAFELDVPRHLRFTVEVEAESRGRRTLRDIVWAPRGHLKITLPRVRTLHGRVVRESEGDAFVGVGGVRVRSYTVECTYYGGISGHPMASCGAGVVTAADGTFAYPGLDRSGVLFLVSDTWEPGPDQDLYRCGLDWRWDRDVTLVVRPKEKRPKAAGARPSEPTEPAAYIQGLVFDEAGEPVGGALVTGVWIERRAQGSDRLRSRDGCTNGRGRFRVDGLPDAEVEVLVRAPGYDTAILDDIRPSRDGTKVPPLHLTRLMPCAGRVIDPKGNPVPTASYGVSIGRPRSGRPVDPLGRFRVEIPRNENYQLTVEAPGFVKRKVGSADRPAEGKWQVILEPAPFIQGRVLDAHGNPVCPARVGTNGRPWIQTWDGASTAPDGTFRLELPEPGTCTLEVEAEGMVFRPKHGVETGTTVTVIQAVLPCVIAGRVAGPPGVMLPRMVVKASPEDDGDTEWDVTDADGRFRVEGLAGETFRVHVSFNDDDLIARGLLVVPQEGVSAWTEDVVLEASYGRTLSGVVAWPDGTPAADAYVSANSDVEDFHVGTVWTGEDGGFTLQRLLPGRYEIHAFKDVEVRAPDENDDEDEGEHLDYQSDTLEVAAGAEGIRLHLRLRPANDE